jgi:probable F420-dependent oxidoreductase
VASGDEVRARVGRVGVWSWTPTSGDLGDVRELVAEAEELGYGAIWYPEAVGRESIATASLLLGWTQRIAVGSSIMNIWARDPFAAAAGARTLEEAYPGRFVHGVGVSHQHVVTMRGHEYAKPLSAMRAYLDAMDASPYPVEDAAESPRVIAALAPKMLALAAERTGGSIPYFVPVEHTAYARERLGKDAFLGVEIPVVLGEGDAGLELARTHTPRYLAAPNYRNNLLRLGWDEADLDSDSGGSDKLVHAIVAIGDEEAIRNRVQEHVDAGADHVCVQVLGDVAQQRDGLRRLAPALL